MSRIGLVPRAVAAQAILARMSPPKQLSQHFSFAEMTRTNHRRFLVENARPPDSLLPTAIALCETVLEPIRGHFGKPIFVHSGYRCPGLNTAIGGSSTSQHVRFAACDFHVAFVPLEEVWQFVWDVELPVSQVILEGWTADRPTWVHVGLLTPAWKKPRQQMTFSAGRYSIVAERPR